MAGGLVTGGFTVYSMVRPIRYETWDLLNSVIYVVFIAALIVLAIATARSDATLLEAMKELARASLLRAAGQIFAYWGTTTYFANRILQLPFFIKDYADHSYVPPAVYLSVGNNYRSLMQLQLTSVAVAVVTQVVVGTGVALAWRRWAAKPSVAGS